jgi:hypothetical protein
LGCTKILLARASRACLTWRIEQLLGEPLPLSFMPTV